MNQIISVIHFVIFLALKTKPSKKCNVMRADLCSKSLYISFPFTQLHNQTSLCYIFTPLLENQLLEYGWKIMRTLHQLLVQSGHAGCTICKTFSTGNCSGHLCLSDASGNRKVPFLQQDSFCRN